jgi:hypothetical protein
LELPQQWKEYVIVPIVKIVIKLTVVIRGISLLPTTYNILSRILISMLTVYIDEIIGDQQCGF